MILTARQSDKLEAHASALRETYNVEVVVIPADLSAPDGADALWRAASDGRRIGVFVNNAGLGHIGAFADEDGWPREMATLSVNVTAATILMKRAAAHMKAAGDGRILNVASTAGFMPGPGMAVYHASKAYLLSLSEALAQELRGSGVFVTALCPGATATSFFAADNATGATLLARMPMATAKSVAKAGWQAMESGRHVKIPGALNKMMAFMPRMLPRWIVNQTTARIHQKRW